MTGSLPPVHAKAAFSSTTIERIREISAATGLDTAAVLRTSIRDAYIVRSRIAAGETLYAESPEGRGVAVRLPPLADFASPSPTVLHFDLSLGSVELLRRLAVQDLATLQAALAGAVATESQLRRHASQGDVLRFGRNDEYSDHVYVPGQRGLESVWAPWDER